MKKLKRVLIGIVAVSVLGPLAVMGGALFSDGPPGGPLEIVRGGPFESGVQYIGSDEPDWSFLADRQTVEFQLLEPPRSRTAWILIHDGRPFIVSGYMTSWYGKIWKQWPIHAQEDGRALLRVDGTLYERQMVRVTDGPDVQPVLDELARKYVGTSTVPAASVTNGDIWMFELRPRR